MSVTHVLSIYIFYSKNAASRTKLRHKTYHLCHTFRDDGGVNSRISIYIYNYLQLLNYRALS